MLRCVSSWPRYNVINLAESAVNEKKKRWKKKDSYSEVSGKGLCLGCNFHAQWCFLHLPPCKVPLIQATPRPPAWCPLQLSSPALRALGGMATACFHFSRRSLVSGDYWNVWGDSVGLALVGCAHSCWHRAFKTLWGWACSLWDHGLDVVESWTAVRGTAPPLHTSTSAEVTRAGTTAAEPAASKTPPERSPGCPCFSTSVPRANSVRRPRGIVVPMG